MTVDRSSNQQQIIQGVLDVPNQALKTTATIVGPVDITLQDPLPVSFSGGTQAVEINSVDDSITIGDDAGNHAQVVGGALKVTGSSTVTGSVTIPPSTDFEPQTVTATLSTQQLTFPSLSQVTSITVFAIGTNTDYILISKSPVATQSNSFLLSPGSTLNLPVSGGASVYYTANSETGSFLLTAIAVN